MPIFRSDYPKPHRCIKNKNQKLDLLLQQLFNFTYAGKAHIFITKRKENYIVVCEGVQFVEDIFCFAPNYFHRFKADTLYNAIKIFNLCVKKLTESMDWFYPDMFKDYSEIFITD